MRFEKGDLIIVKDLRDNHSVPDGMKMFSGHTGRVTAVFDSQDTINTYYTITCDDGQGIWSETFLAKAEDNENPYIDTVIGLLRDVETTIETIKRILWQKKHYNEQ